MKTQRWDCKCHLEVQVEKLLVTLKLLQKVYRSLTPASSPIWPVGMINTLILRMKREGWTRLHLNGNISQVVIELH